MGRGGVDRWLACLALLLVMTSAASLSAGWHGAERSDTAGMDQTPTPNPVTAQIGSLVYVAENDGLVIYDVQTPDDQQRIGTLRLGSRPLALTIRTPLAFVLLADGLQILDVRAPAQPFLRGRYPVIATGPLTLVDNTVLLGTTNGVIKIDIHNPDAPRLLRHE